MMIIYNTTELNSGIGVYAYNLSKGLNIKLENDFLSNKHYYVDYFKRSLSRKRVDQDVINSSIFSNYYLGRKNIFIIHDFFYKDYSNHTLKFSKFIFDYALFLSKINSDKFICISNYTYKRALDEGLKNLEMIYPFVDMRFNYQKEKNRNRVVLLMDASNYENKNPKYYQRFYEYIFLNEYEFYGRINKLGYPLRPIVMDFKTKNYVNISIEEVIDVYKNSNVFFKFLG